MGTPDVLCASDWPPTAINISRGQSSPTYLNSRTVDNVSDEGQKNEQMTFSLSNTSHKLLCCRRRSSRSTLHRIAMQRVRQQMHEQTTWNLMQVMCGFNLFCWHKLDLNVLSLWRLQRSCWRNYFKRIGHRLFRSKLSSQMHRNMFVHLTQITLNGWLLIAIIHNIHKHLINNYMLIR